MDAFMIQSNKTPASKRSLIEVPNNLDSLSREKLLGLVTALASERDEQLSRKRSKATIKPKASASIIQTTLTPKKVPSLDVNAIKKRLLTKSVKAIKKTKHNDKRKPYTEISEGLSSKEEAIMLLKDFPMKSDNARMTKWVLGPGDIESFIGCESTIHPVAFDGKVWCFGGGKPNVYAQAGFESLEVKFEPASSLLTLKFRTYLAGYGNPDMDMIGMF
jgi:hypothetical protein